MNNWTHLKTDKLGAEGEAGGTSTVCRMLIWVKKIIWTLPIQGKIYKNLTPMIGDSYKHHIQKCKFNNDTNVAQLGFSILWSWISARASKFRSPYTSIFVLHHIITRKKRKLFAASSELKIFCCHDDRSMRKCFILDISPRGEKSVRCNGQATLQGSFCHLISCCRLPDIQPFPALRMMA